jgi:hypothetical protein
MYDELVYHLDLCILSYHLHNQTLIWPMDPYYEQMGGRRAPFMDVVRKFHPPSILNWRGPGHFAGWPTNERLDPIVSQYKPRIDPRRPSFVRPNREREPWIVYNTPEEITKRIKSVSMVEYDRTKGPYSGHPELTGYFIIPPPDPQNPNPNNLPHPDKTDLLYCFEGGTGGIGVGGDREHASWSMMGFVLARVVTQEELGLPSLPTPAPYDVHIVFRGSRSGKVRPVESFWIGEGHPDWATDGDFFKVLEDGFISMKGSVCRGFATSVRPVLRTVIKCLEDIQSTNGRAPRIIYVTGHSLGGALAGLFTSSVMAGDRYGPHGTGHDMPAALKVWPWRGMQLITFSAPIIGGEDFHDYFDHGLASRRIWLNGDPITQERRHYPVGGPYRIPTEDIRPKITSPTESHEPYLIRECLIKDREKWGFPIKQIPAFEKGRSDPKAPWRLVKTCGGMLDHISTLHTNSVILHRPELWTCFTDFAENFRIFLRLLGDYQKTVDPRGKEPNRIDHIKVFTGAVDNVISGKSDSSDLLMELERAWNSASPLRDKGFSGLHDFFGIGLMLSAIGSKRASVQAIQTSQQHPNLKKLLDKEI